MRVTANKGDASGGGRQRDGVTGVERAVCVWMGARCDEEYGGCGVVFDR